MFKLFFSNEKNISDSILKIKNDNNHSFYIEFNEELNKFVSYHVNAFNTKENKELFTAFIHKFLSIIDLNRKYNSNYEMYNFVYFNLSSLILKNNDYVYTIFFKSFEYIIEEITGNFKEINEKELMNQLSILLKDMMNNNKDTEDFEGVFSIFCKKFIPSILNIFHKKYIEQIKPSTKTFFSFVIFVLPYFKIFIHEMFTKYFETYQHVTKEKIFITSLINSISSFVPQSQESESDIALIVSLLSNNQFNHIGQVMSLFCLDQTLLNNFFGKLIKGIYEYLSTSLQNTKNPLDKFVRFKEIEEYFFSIQNRIFYFDNIKDSQNIIDEYHKIIYDILTKENNTNINESFVKAIDLAMRQENDNNSLYDTIFSYFDIIPQYESFEWIYIHSVVNRGVDECFDYIKEKKVIERIENLSREKCAYSYRLQTLISNIKISRNDKMSLIVLPFHSYHLFNQSYKPKIDKYLMNLFKDFIKNSKFPENSHLIYQQGFIEFFAKTKILQHINIKSDIIQFTILNFIGLKKRKFSEIKPEINVDEDMIRFLLCEIEKKDIISYDDKNDTYWINEKVKNALPSSTVDIRVNYELFFEGGGNYSTYQRKMTEKYQGMVWDCYIIKHLKQEQKTKKPSSLDSILDYLKATLPNNSKSFLTKETLTKNLSVLVTKGFIINPSPFQYKYI